MGIVVVADQDTHLLISDDQHYAVVERRNGRFYNCHDSKRDGVPDISAVGQVLGRSDWTDEATARATFDDVVDRGVRLAQKIR